MYEIKPEQKVNDSSLALLDSHSKLSSREASLQFAHPFVQQLGLLLEQTAIHVFGVGSLQGDGVFLTSPVQSDPGGVIVFGGLDRFHECSLLSWMRIRWLRSCATLIVESSYGTTSEYALSDQSATLRSKVYRKPSNGWGGEFVAERCVSSIRRSPIITQPATSEQLTTGLGKEVCSKKRCRRTIRGGTCARPSIRSETHWVDEDTGRAPTGGAPTGFFHSLITANAG